MTTSVIGRLRLQLAAQRGRCTPALLLLLGWLLLAQTLLAIHTVDHAKAENGAPCALCVAGDHLAGAAANAIHDIAPATPHVVASARAATVTLPIRAVYRSRAPPSFLQTC
jgi:hypothetical protein